MTASTRALLSRAELAHARLLQSLSSAMTPVAVLWAITNEAIGVLALEDCVVYLREGEQLTQIAAFGPKMAAPQLLESRIKLEFGQGIVGHCAQTGLSLRIDDTADDPRYLIDDHIRPAELAVPILASDGRVLGVIDSEHSRRGHFTPTHQQILEQIAAMAALRLEQLQAASTPPPVSK